jgi:hypothetical protein
MTLKDYQIVATAIAQAHSESKSEGERKGVDRVMEHMAHAFEVTYPNFRPATFIQFISKLLRSYVR